MKRLIYLFVLSVMPWLGISCEKESFVTDDGAVKLTFSADTLTFDTVFTTIGTATRRVTVYNNSSDNLKLNSITLAGGRTSRFRLNVDGDTSMVARGVEIEAGDSIFIFAQANINPYDTTSPFLVEDAIVFSNGQRLPLTAYGRNAIYHKPIHPDSVFIRLSSQTWTDSLPHVVLGNLLVSSNQTLVLDSGAEVHFGNDAMLIVGESARLVVRGTVGRPVLFTSLRHDGWYSFLPGQWQTIWFYNYSSGVIDHAIIENGTGGLRGYPGADLKVYNTVVRNMSDCGIIGQGATITGNNLLVYDCLCNLTVLMGGSYEFRRCTFANYWSYSARKIQAVVLSNCMNTKDGVVGGDLLKADFDNCIVWGTYSSGEVLLSKLEPYAMNYLFREGCFVRGGDRDEDPLFTDPRNDDYTLQDNSPAVNKGCDFSMLKL